MMSEESLIDIRNSPVCVDEVLKAVRHPGAGGIALFVGTVRDHNEGHAVVELEYEAYGAMAKAELRRIASELQTEHPELRLAVIHRVGPLQVGDVAILCAASAPHRALAFDACRALIDRIKERVPVWKRERGPEGSTWVGWESGAEKQQ